MGDDARDRPLSRDELAPDPLAQFDRWFGEAREAGVPMPEAVALATAGPSARMVLLKGYDARGLVFASGYASRKARELEHEGAAALLFYWHALGRQVRVEGIVERTSAEESDALHAARPRASQLAAWASRQSAELPGRAELDAAVERYERDFAGRNVPRPPHWGGFRVRPHAWEFWQHRENRLHDRFAYERGREPDGGDAWRLVRLAP